MTNTIATQPSAAPTTKWATALRDLLIDVQAGVLDGDAARDAQAMLDNYDPDEHIAAPPADAKARFEEWASRRGYSLMQDREGYQIGQTTHAWNGYQAALAQQAAPGAQATEHSGSIKQLMRFYRVETLEALAEAQATHIERLQAKLPQLTQPVTTREREG
jgi:hypothetical protein